MLYIDNSDKETLRYRTKENYNYIDLLECEDPFCSCSNGQLIFLTKEEYGNESSTGIPLKINIGTQKIELVDYKISKLVREKSQILKENLEKQLEVEDWNLLKEKYRFQKNIRIENSYIEKIGYEYHFPIKHYEDESLMISYQTIFPYCEIFKVNHEDGEFEIIEHYCKNINCDCKDVNFQVFKKGKYVFDFMYNYGKDRVSDKTKNWIIDSLKNYYIEFELKLKLRDLRIKNLYAKSIITLQRELRNKLEGTTPKQKIGRNEPCPCGSGKKYKRCCLVK